ncbi:MAG: DMT family transporter [Candidatus Paceibacterota bacterium]|jgi:transporter family protein
MIWLILVLLGTFFWSITTILQRAFLKEEQSNHYSYAIIFQLLVAILIFIYTLFAGLNLPDFKEYYINIILMVILYALGNLTMYKGMQLVEASEKAIIYSSNAIWTMLLAALFLKEQITYLRITGAFFIILSVIIISYKKGSFKFKKGHILIMLTAVIFGFAFINDIVLLKTIDAASLSVLGFGLPSIALFLARPKIAKEFKFFFEKKRLLKIIGAGLFYAAAAVLIKSAYRVGGDASQIAPITQLTIIITVMLAYVFLKEKKSLLKKIIGSVLALIGVLLII